MSKPILGFLLLGLALMVSWWAVPGYQKAQADALVRDLCTKDGGIKVYRTVAVPAQSVGPFGNVLFAGNKNLPPLKNEVRPTDPFYFTAEISWIKGSDRIDSLAIWKSHQKLFRRENHEILGEAISYSRRGGDPIGPWHPSSYGCPADADIVNLVTKVFIKH